MILTRMQRFGMTTLAAIGATLALTASIHSLPANAQPSPQPQECSCSAGVNIGTDAAPVIIRHCQCGILSCVVVVSSGQLQCGR